MAKGLHDVQTQGSRRVVVRKQESGRESYFADGRSQTATGLEFPVGATKLTVWEAKRQRKRPVGLDVLSLAVPCGLNKDTSTGNLKRIMSQNSCRVPTWMHIRVTSRRVHSRTPLSLAVETEIGRAHV